jgi:subtilisin family serine protease
MGPESAPRQPHQALRFANLDSLMALTPGRPDVIVGLVDGPVSLEHPALRHVALQTRSEAASCAAAASVACRHGTAVAGILFASRDSASPGICPACTLTVRTIFAESRDLATPPSASAGELAAAIVECVAAGARIVNLSVAVGAADSRDTRALEQALQHAMDKGVLLVAAAGNQGVLGSSVLTRHPWVIPVVACGLDGVPLPFSNLGHSIGRHGLRAPGRDIVTVRSDGGMEPFDGTSAAAPFVTGTLALLRSLLPSATPRSLRQAVNGGQGGRVVPPLLNAWKSFQALNGATPPVRAD